jgi:cytochrome c peroxidase
MGRLWNALKRLSICSLILLSPAVAEAFGGATLDGADIARIRELLRDEAADTTASNRYTGDPDAIDFGRKAFFSAELSRDRSLSCASCHDPQRNWTDGRALALRGTRNTPTLWNLRGALWMGWTGEADSLWAQVARVVESGAEFDLFRAAFLRRIAESTELAAAYETAFGALPHELTARAPACATVAECEPWWSAQSAATRQSIDVAFANAAKGIAAFVADIRAPDSKFFALADRMNADGPGATTAAVALTDSEMRGFRLFVGKAQCTFCHHGRSLSDGEFHNIRLRSLSAADSNDRYTGIVALRKSQFNLLSPHNDAPQTVRHTRYVVPSYAFLNNFRTPSLVGVGRTAPYMHDGRFATLAEVIDYYSEFRGSAEAGHHETVILRPLKLNDAEKADLIAFLQSL